MNNAIVVREVTVEDRIALWDWRNNSVSRKIFNINPLVTYKHHQLWFDRLIKTEKALLYIGLVETLRVGCVRFDIRAESEFEVKVYIKPIYCGKGFGTPMLKQSLELLQKACKVDRIYTTIKKVNSSSGAIFENVGFRITNKDDHILLCEYII
jgi:RimJ/RimL family protein N-acetyltransferase